MRYRTIPFARKRARRTVSPQIPRGAIMNGLEPMGTGPTTWGYLGPRSGMAAYGAEYPNSSFLSGGIPVAAPPPENTTTLRMRPDTTKPPGFPGFYAWLADYNPAAFNYAMAITPPHLVSQSKVLRTSGAQLGEIYRGSFKARQGMGDTSAYSSYTGSPSIPQSSAPSLIDTSFDTGSVAAPATVAIADTGETSGSPVMSSNGTAQLVTSLTAAGQAIVQGVNNQTIFNAQLARAEAGLPPLNTSAYGIGSTISSALSDPTTLLLIAGGVGLLIYLSSRGGGSKA
jgi:hypothetical protein